MRFLFLLQLLALIVVASDKVIVGKLDWSPIPTPENVFELIVPKYNAQCVGWYIKKNHVITNYHCIPKKKYVRGTYIRHSPMGNTIKCDKLFSRSRWLDYIILECEEKRKPIPWGVWGKKYVEVIHKQCDYPREPRCRERWVKSEGLVVKDGDNKFRHSADTLSGSSGSPVLNAKGHVVGLHSAGVGGDEYQRGSYNVATRIDKIMEHAYGVTRDGRDVPRRGQHESPFTLQQREHRSN